MWHRGVSVGALALLLAACGGGPGTIARPAPPPAPPIGGTPTPTPTPAPTPTPTPTPVTQRVDYDTAEYRNSGGAAGVDAIRAYQAGATGAGIAIGIVDTGINPTLSAFAGRISSASGDVAGNRGISDEGGHGTAVAAVAAAARDDRDTLGVAFDATVVAVRADDVGTCATDEGCLFSDREIARGIDRATQAGVRVINLSLGGEGAGRSVIDAVRRAAAAGIVTIVSAGNEGAALPSGFASTLAAAAPGLVIIAGATNRSGTIAGFSNRAGDARDVYLAAPGSGLLAPDHTGRVFSWSGTSFSAPVISGAAALLADAFPNLTGAQIVAILLDSADDIEAAGIDAISGRGRLNLGRAFAPSGATVLAGSDVAISLTSNGTLPVAAGDAGGGAGTTALFTDSYERAYELDLSRTLDMQGHAGPMQRRFATAGSDVRATGIGAGPLRLAMTVGRDGPRDTALLAPLDTNHARDARLLAARIVAKVDDRTALALGFSEGAQAMRDQLSATAGEDFLAARDTDLGFTALRDTSIAVRRDLGGVGLTLSAERGAVVEPSRAPGEERAGYSLLAAGLDGSLGDWGRGALTLGRLDEDETLLGGHLSSALGGGTGATTVSLDARWRSELGAGWSVGLDARRGWTTFEGGSFTTSAYAADIALRGLFETSDRLALRVSQPLRIGDGGLALNMATAWDPLTGRATFGTRHFALSPSGRERIAELAYGGTLGPGRVDANLYTRFQPGHIKGVDNDTGVRVGYRLGF
ncbi:S8 family peptidase [Sphingomicrobium sp. XHP0239]|uniref:S8 family peptidase n=1 Tax=Sphingomicrobium maritimum TaxID=3133972 RepID=UPI0031CC57B2